MLKKFTPIVIVIISIILFTAMKQPEKQVVQIQTEHNNYNLIVDVANTNHEQKKGLMGREHLAEDEGMFFVYKEEINPVFWMKNMKIPLDIIFVSSNNIIQYIEKAVPPCTSEDSECIKYSSPEPVQYVLEVQSGFSDKYGVRVGDFVQIL